MEEKRTEEKNAEESPMKNKQTEGWQMEGKQTERKRTGDKQTENKQMEEGQMEEKLAAALAKGGEEWEDILWQTLAASAGFTFRTSKGLEFSYAIRGNEMFVDRKTKSITRATVNMACRKALELGKEATGPKKLGTFGASYLYPVFVRLGIIRI